jgi:hypothetical protein
MRWQALGGRTEWPTGGSTLPLPALRQRPGRRGDRAFRRGARDGRPAGWVEELAHASGFTRLRDLDVPENELDEVAEAAAQRAGAKANPRPASPAEIVELYHSIW